jgi:hypothetical protein
MNTPRPSSRRDYRHFPEAYTSLLLTFDRDSGATLGPMAIVDARSSVRDLYRFKMFLSAGCDADPDDAHCRALLRIFAKAIIRIVPIAQSLIVADDRGPFVQTIMTGLRGTDEATHANIVLSLNPIVAAMEAHQ